jgi:hypothetical protein
MKKIITIILVICFGTKILAQSTYNYHICQGDSITLSEDSSVTIPGLIIPGFSDDNVRGPFSIGFPFCFYGSTYNQFYVGSNGWVGFSGAQTSTGITTAIPSIISTVPKNAIMACWQDLNPGMGGNIKFGIWGTSPNRKLIVTYLDVPYFSCTASYASLQIVLNESTNTIETNILEKPICAGWNNGNAVHGLQNIDGTLASVVPGRNNTAFAVMNETKRFVPVYSGNDCSTLAEYQIEDAPFIFYGLSNATNIEWFALPDTSNAISTSFELNVTPNSTTIYRAKRYFNSAFVLSNYSVEVSSFNVNIQTTDFICNQDSIGSIVALNMNSGLLYLALSNSSGNIIENGVYTDSIIFYPPAIGNYTVIASDNFGCTQSYPVSISSANTPLQLSLLCIDTISCLGTETATIFVDLNGGSGASTITSLPLMNINNGFAQTNIYGNYTFIASDSAGCSVTQSINIQSYNAIQSINHTQFFPYQNLSGFINISEVVGGSAPFEYSINGSDFTNNSLFENLIAGDYSITVQDSIGCTYTEIVTLTENSNELINVPVCPNGGTTLVLPNSCNMPGSAISGFLDDNVRGSFDIGFDFCFYGNTYNQFFIGSNGWVGFSSGQTGSWVAGSIPNASSNFPKNAIFNPFHDINPVIGGQIKMETIGQAPNRKLIVSWCQVPYFNCTSFINTSQIVLHESTNFIDTYIYQKQICANWNNGNATHGIQNSNGTLATVVPGRNNTPWQANNDAKRFIPSGCSSPVTYSLFAIPFTPYTYQNFSWYQLPDLQTVISTSNTLNVNPDTNTVYRCVFGIANETEYQDFLVTIQSPSININTADFICNADSNGLAQASINSAPPYTFVWKNTNNDTLFFETTNSGNSTFNPPSIGNYNLTVISANNCVSNSNFNLGSYFSPITIDSTVIDPVSCYNNSIGSVSLFANGGNENYDFLMPSGVSNNTGVFVITSPGNYLISITDTNNCNINQSVFVPFIDGPQNINFSIENQNCDSLSSINVSDVVGGAAPYQFLLDGLPYQINNNVESVSEGFHNLVITDSNGCSFTQQFFVPIITPITQTNIWQSSDSLFVVINDSIVYNWFMVGDSINVLSSENYFVPSTEGTYYVTLTNQYGCSVVSEPYNFIFSSTTNFSDLGKLKIFPNPAQNNFVIETINPAQLEIFEATGRKLFEENKFSLNLKINREYFSSGIYYVRVTFKDKTTITKKLVLN